MNETEKLLSVKQIAEYIGISIQTVRKYRKLYNFPKPKIQQTKILRFDKREVDNFFKNRQ